ncbi:MAG: ABC transporter permease subunit [Clostridia bacterium]|nr:ABC transporter permease subunit [Clostridia bacterium]
MAGVSAFNVLLFRNFFNSIPMSYLEAARIDGCSDLGIFIKIIIPLSKPIIMVVTIFSVTETWGNFMWPYLILGNTAKEPVSVMLYRLSTGASLLDNEYMILLMLSIIPMIIIYAIFSKHIMGGLNMSDLKG